MTECRNANILTWTHTEHSSRSKCCLKLIKKNRVALLHSFNIWNVIYLSITRLIVSVEKQLRYGNRTHYIPTKSVLAFHQGAQKQNSTDLATTKWTHLIAFMRDSGVVLDLPESFSKSFPLIWFSKFFLMFIVGEQILGPQERPVVVNQKRH